MNNLYSKICLLFLIIVLESVSTYSLTNNSAKKECRRHYLIFYDNSASFTSSKNKNARNQMFADVSKLFSNEIPVANGDKFKLNEEHTNNTYFFNPDKDEISFFYFGLNRDDNRTLKSRLEYYKSEKILYKEFLKRFIKKGYLSWQEYKNKNISTDVKQYIAKVLLSPAPKWGNGHSFSNLVIPFGLYALKTEKYAEEYYVIILSDFLSGSDFGNSRDLQTLKSWIFNNQNYYFDDISNVFTQITHKINKVDYFSFSYNTGYSGTDNRLIQLGALGYKIKVNTGKPTTDNTLLFIDSDIELEQKSYQSSVFDLSPQRIKFTHNANLAIEELKLNIINNKGENIYELDNVDFSKLLDNNSLPKYSIESQKIDFQNLSTKNDFKTNSPILLTYQFLTKYALTENSNLKLIYKVPERNITLSSIEFKQESKIKFMIYFLPFVALFILALIIAGIGKPRNITANITRFFDSYELINTNQGFTRLKTDYIPDLRNGNSFNEVLKIKGAYNFTYKHYPFNWKRSNIVASLAGIEHKPEKMDIYLKEAQNSKRQYYIDERFKIRKNNNGFELLVCFVDDDTLNQYVEPTEIKFRILLTMNERRLFFIKKKWEKYIDYHFQIGQDLEDVWVGIDPGTTGTCIATSNTSNNIIIEKDEKGNEKIMPSIIAFNPDRNLNSDKFPHFDKGQRRQEEKYFRYGTEADRRIERGTDITFQSVKKLLGYDNKKKICFKDKEIELSGKQLTSLLIANAYKDLETFINSKNIRLNDEGSFNPKRAVVAVPNNFTISKIVDMVEAFDNVLGEKNEKKFKEIRYVYESEAILFNYISNYSNYNNEPLNNETVLVFDMGGATINASVINISRFVDKDKQTNYKTEILGKLGYGIGGDTIDYVLIKLLLDYSGNLTNLNNFIKVAFNENHPEVKTHRTKLNKLALEIKKQIIDNQKQNKKYIIAPTEFIEAVNDCLNIELRNIESNQALLNLFGYKEKIKNDIQRLETQMKAGIATEEEQAKLKELINKYDAKHQTLLQHQYFNNYIYDNVRSSVQDVTKLSGSKINTIIFSGRSVFFPKIKETVIKEFGKDIKTISLSFNESKTAVAKGACWYGVNKSRIHLNNIKTNGIFGFKYSDSGVKGKDKFVKLIDFGARFNSMIPPRVSGKATLKSNFGFDNNHVEFYQIMGMNVQEIINSDELSHKRSKIARIQANNTVEEEFISVFENDDIICKIKLATGKTVTANKKVLDSEITDENEEHYTWYVK